jgi:BlaI family transcriptional regulator, penicillinase repressor
MAADPTRMGKVQLEIMRVLWREGRATARVVTDELARAAPIAHSTVQTLLRKLEAKGAVAHEAEGRVFYFRPLVHQTDVRLSAVQEVLTRMYDGSLSGLVAHLINAENVPADEMARLRELLEQKE